MERFSVILFTLCSLAIQAGSTPAGLSTIETLWDNTRNVSDAENHEAVLLKSQNVQNSTKQFLIDEDPVRNTTEIGEYAKDSSHLKAANVSTTLSSDFSNSYAKDTQHSKHNEDHKDDAYHKEGPAGILSSHDILLDPSLIPARLSRQAEKIDVDYSNLASIENISSGIEPNNHDESRKNVVPLKRSSNFEDDLGVAEDRYPPPYPYWNPYYQRQFPNQRYRINDRREPYHNYWRYPVFPGK